jgi:hypothetical protein
MTHPQPSPIPSCPLGPDALTRYLELMLFIEHLEAQLRRSSPLHFLARRPRRRPSPLMIRWCRHLRGWQWANVLHRWIVPLESTLLWYLRGTQYRRPLRRLTPALSAIPSSQKRTLPGHSGSSTAPSDPVTKNSQRVSSRGTRRPGWHPPGEHQPPVHPVSPKLSATCQRGVSSPSSAGNPSSAGQKQQAVDSRSSQVDSHSSRLERRSSPVESRSFCSDHSRLSNSPSTSRTRIQAVNTGDSRPAPAEKVRMELHTLIGQAMSGNQRSKNRLIQTMLMLEKNIAKKHNQHRRTKNATEADRPVTETVSGKRRRRAVVPELQAELVRPRGQEQQPERPRKSARRVVAASPGEWDHQSELCRSAGGNPQTIMTQPAELCRSSRPAGSRSPDLSRAAGVNQSTAGRRLSNLVRPEEMHPAVAGRRLSNLDQSAEVAELRKSALPTDGVRSAARCSPTEGTSPQSRFTPELTTLRLQPAPGTSPKSQFTPKSTVSRSLRWERKRAADSPVKPLRWTQKVPLSESERRLVLRCLNRHDWRHRNDNIFPKSEYTHSWMTLACQNFQEKLAFIVPIEFRYVTERCHDSGERVGCRVPPDRGRVSSQARPPPERWRWTEWLDIPHHPSPRSLSPSDRCERKRAEMLAHDVALEWSVESLRDSSRYWGQQVTTPNWRGGLAVLYSGEVLSAPIRDRPVLSVSHRCPRSSHEAWVRPIITDKLLSLWKFSEV